MDTLRRERIGEVYDKWEKRVPNFSTASAAGKSNGGTARRRNGYNKGGGNYRYRQPQQSSSAEPRQARYKTRLEKQSRDRASAAIASSLSQKGFVPSLGFDLGAARKTYAHKSLSLHTSCSKCLPSGKSKFISDDQVGAPLHDLIMLPRRSFRGVLGSLCPTLAWSVTMPLVGPLVDPRDPTRTSTRVASAIQDSALTILTEQNQDKASLEPIVQLQQKRAYKIVTEMSGTVYHWLLRLSCYTLHWVFWKLFRRLHVQGSHIDMLLEVQKKNVPIVFLPSHKSHLDYILISFILTNIGVKAPHIAAGDNLNIPVFNWLIRHLGGWFIRRKLDNGNSRDTLYRKCLHEYMEQLLKTNQNIEFYIEGSRSRTGKPALPKGGLLSLLVESIRDGVVSDVMIVPTSITYDRIVERNFIRHELLGGSKKPENFLKGLKGVWSMLTMNIGCVRMDFAQPFSLKEYLYTHHIAKLSLMDLSLPPSVSSPNSKSSPDRRLITALSYHITYDFNCCAPVMSTNIIGFLLLTKYRNGVTVPDLIHSYNWMTNKITGWGRAIGYSGPPSEAVHYALAYLNHLIVREKENKMVELILPRLELPDVFELLHHTNQASLGFIKDAIIACSIAVLLEEADSTSDNSGNEADKDDTTILHISQTELSDKAVHIARIFAKEFVYSPPCVDITTALFEGVETLKRLEILKDVQYSSHHGSSLYQNSRRTKRSWEVEDWGDDESEEDEDLMLEVSSSLESTAYLYFLQSVLGPFSEGYWNCAVLLYTVIGEEKAEIDESNFLKLLQLKMNEKASKGLLFHIESCSSDILRNSLRSFLSMEVISADQDGKWTISDENKLFEVIDTLSICKL